MVRFELGERSVATGPGLRFGLSALSLLGANVVTIVLAVARGWALSDVMWVYWGQSIIIGFFQFLRMLRLRQFSTDGVKMNDQPVPPTTETKVRMAGFFVVHYAFFHVGYLFALGSELGPPQVPPLMLATCLGAFVVNHGFSFVHNFELDRRRRPNIGTVMLFPYARIIPMHVAIATGAFVVKGTFGLVVFLGLKTAADLVMHGIEHSEALLPDVAEAGSE
jgi:hypothetical protein